MTDSPPRLPPLVEQLVTSLRSAPQAREAVSNGGHVLDVPELGELFKELVMLADKSIEHARLLRVPLGDPDRSWSDVEAALDQAAEHDLFAVVCRFALDAARAWARSRPREAEKIARRALRMLDTIPTACRPPYVPLELPWLPRLPFVEEVAAHAQRHLVPGTPGAGLWLVSSLTNDSSTTVELFAIHGEVWSWSHHAEDGSRGVPMGKLKVTGCRFLPMTASHFPVCLFTDPAPPVDGAPLRHVPTVTALAKLGDLLESTKEDSYTPAAVDLLAVDDLRAVVRERDHHAGRVGELLRDCTWFQLRARAFARALPDVTCAGCGWTGDPYAANLSTEGRLTCPCCGVPGIYGATPGPTLLMDLGAALIPAYEAAMVKGADASRWREVGAVASAMVTLTSVQSPQGRGARRAALRAAISAGDAALGEKLRAAYVEEASVYINSVVEETPDNVTRYRGQLAVVMDEFIVELTTIAGGFEPARRPTWDAERACWTCCGLPVCACAAAWGMPS